MATTGRLPETHGLELEALIVDQSGDPLPLAARHWQGLLALTGGTPHYSILDDVQHLIGVDTPHLHYGLDASRALVEIGYAPQHDLNRLADLVRHSLQEFHQALWEEAGERGAAMLSLSMHPLAQRTREVYDRVVTPKKLYRLLWEWNWDHTAGIFSAAMQPWTSIDVYRAADALAVMQGFSGPILALFANSPLVEGRLTGYKENRERIWQQMLGQSRRLSDRQLVQMLPTRPRTLAQYFQWLYGDKTMFVVLEGSDYKTAGLFVVPAYPPLLEYLKQEEWWAYELGNPGHVIRLRPTLFHLFTHQWSYFGPARWRYQVCAEAPFTLQSFLQAVQNTQEKELEALLAPYLEMSCIETRCMGTALPYGESPFPNEAMAGNALQAGLLRNLDAAVDLIDAYPWSFWQKLREAAIRDGLDAVVEGISIYPLACRMLEIAAQGLRPEEQWMLAPLQVMLERKQSNADVVIGLYQQARQEGKSAEEACREIMSRRRYAARG